MKKALSVVSVSAILILSLALISCATAPLS